MKKTNNVIIYVPVALEGVVAQRLGNLTYDTQFEFSFCEQCVDRLVKTILLTTPRQPANMLPTRCSEEQK